MKPSAPSANTHGYPPPGNTVVRTMAADPRFDRLCLLAARTCQTPTALIVLRDETGLWCLAAFGASNLGTAGDLPFCTHVVETGLPLVIEDVPNDPRGRPFLAGRESATTGFYAGIPLQDPTQGTVGALCVMDHAPRARLRGARWRRSAGRAPD